MQYRIFEIAIRAVGGTSGAAGRLFEAQVTRAPYDAPPGGWSSVQFERPLADDHVGELFELVERQVRSGREARSGRRRRPRPSDVTRLAEAGKTLYRAVFRDEIVTVFDKARRDLGPDQGLRVQIRIALDDNQVAYLAALPWELLCDPETATFMATDRQTPVVRHLVSRMPRPQHLKIEPPLRILVVEAAPTEMAKLDLTRETERIREALEHLTEVGEVEILSLVTPTLDSLREALLDQTFHVLHFMGHGGYHAGRGIGAVFFERSDGSRDQVEGLELAESLKSTSPLKLIVLNACKTARHAGGVTDSYQLGAAAALIERLGVPALVANQYAISDRAAIELSRKLYGRIAKGDPVEAAITEARQPLKREGAEWLTPVLFQSADDGRLVEAGRTGASAVVSVTRCRAERQPLRLGIRSFVDHHRRETEDVDELLALEDSFEDRLIGDEAWWQERILPRLEQFLLENTRDRRRIVLVLTAHQSIAFAAGWILEAKSGLDVRVLQPTLGSAALEWHPQDDTGGDDPCWLDRADLDLADEAPDIAVALSVTRPPIAQEVAEFVAEADLPIGRVIDATIAPEPGPRSVRGGEHCLRLAQTLAPRSRQRSPHERQGRLHLFGAAPNALLFYLGQLARPWGPIVLYEYPGFGAAGSYGHYRPSIELPSPEDSPAEE